MSEVSPRLLRVSGGRPVTWEGGQLVPRSGAKWDPARRKNRATQMNFVYRMDAHNYLE
jgi:hypothetical protein